MESRPTIRIWSAKIQPEYEERFLNWIFQVYYPLLIPIPHYLKFEAYQILRRNPQYGETLSIYYYANRGEQLKVRDYQKLHDVQNDVNRTWASRSETIWYPSYELMRNFRGKAAVSEGSDLLETENAPIMHLEGFSLPTGDQEKFETWFSKWGYELYIPWLMKMPGLMEYSCYKLNEIVSPTRSEYYTPKRPVEYPPYLSILHFKDREAYNTYENSIELAGFRDHIKMPFPRGLDFTWYVQYQLVKSWRK